MDKMRYAEYEEASKYVPSVNCEENEHKQEMFTNCYFAACDFIGGLENTFYDYDESEEEYISAKETLKNHELLCDTIYCEATSALYGAGYVSGGMRAKQIIKSYHFAGKDFTINAIEEIVKSMGY